ncbi:PARP16 [Scenedesmus sp. PABB004]|nr:PARP16 [Scenedesmus sp. PABB004]
MPRGAAPAALAIVVAAVLAIVPGLGASGPSLATPLFAWAPEGALFASGDQAARTSYQVLEPHAALTGLVDGALGRVGEEGLVDADAARGGAAPELVLLLLGSQLKTSDLRSAAAQAALAPLQALLGAAGSSLTLPYVLHDLDALGSRAQRAQQLAAALDGAVVVGCAPGDEQSLDSALAAAGGDGPAVVLACTRSEAGDAGAPAALAAEVAQVASAAAAAAASGRRAAVVYAVHPDPPTAQQRRRLLATAGADAGVCGALCQTQVKWLEGILAAAILAVAAFSGMCCLYMLDTPTRFEKAKEGGRAGTGARIVLARGTAHKSWERVLRYPSGETRYIRYPIEATLEEEGDEEGGLGGWDISGLWSGRPTQPGRSQGAAQQQQQQQQQPAPPSFQETAAYLEGLFAASYESRPLENVEHTYEVLRGCPWVLPRPLFVLALRERGAALEDEGVRATYTLRTKVQQEGAAEALAQLLNKQHLAGALDVAEMRDGVVAFEAPGDADSFAGLLEEEGHSQVLVAEVDSHKLFRMATDVRALVVLLPAGASVPAPYQLAASLKQQRSWDSISAAAAMDDASERVAAVLALSEELSADRAIANDLMLSALLAAAQSPRRASLCRPWPATHVTADLDAAAAALDALPRAALGGGPAGERALASASALQLRLLQAVFLQHQAKRDWRLTLTSPDALAAELGQALPPGARACRCVLRVDRGVVAAARGPRLVALHGTDADSAWSILHTGLLAASGTRLQSTGAAHGSGIYAAEDFDTAVAFSTARRGWRGSAIAQHLRVVLVCEVAAGAALRGGPGAPGGCGVALGARGSCARSARRPRPGPGGAPPSTGPLRRRLPAKYVLVPRPADVAVRALLVLSDDALRGAAARHRGAAACAALTALYAAAMLLLAAWRLLR